MPNNTEKTYLIGVLVKIKDVMKLFQNKPMNKLEKKVSEYLDGLGLDYTFQFFITEDGVCKSYDFKFNNSPYILEVHGDY